MVQTTTFKCLAIVALTSTITFTNATNPPNVTTTTNNLTHDGSGQNGSSINNNTTETPVGGGSMNGSRLGDNLQVSDKFSASSMFTNNTCTGTPVGISYSNIQAHVSDDKCDAAATANDLSVKTNTGISDVFHDAKQRFGCTSSFVLVGKGDNCQVGTKTGGTSWVALQADGICNQGSFGLDLDGDDHDSHQPNATQPQKASSVKVKMTGEKLKISTYKDPNCHKKDKHSTIDIKSKRVGNYFCHDHHVYQVFDASGKSTLFKSTVPEAECNPAPGAVGRSSSSHLMHEMGLLAVLVVVTTTTLMAF